MSYLKLIKLLYLLDREALLRGGRPVTTDRYVSMANGPVVSRIYELIREEPAPGADPVWRHYISAPQEWWRFSRNPKRKKSPARKKR